MLKEYGYSWQPLYVGLDAFFSLKEPPKVFARSFRIKSQKSLDYMLKPRLKLIEDLGYKFNSENSLDLELIFLQLKEILKP